MKDQDHTTAGKSWKITLATLVGLFLAAMAASMIIAGQRVSRVVDPDYYNHGLHYGEARETDGDAVGGKR